MSSFAGSEPADPDQSLCSRTEAEPSSSKARASDDQATNIGLSVSWTEACPCAPWLAVTLLIRTRVSAAGLKRTQVPSQRGLAVTKRQRHRPHCLLD